MTTNLQRIRQMNSEELAEFLQNTALDGVCSICDACDSEEEIGCIKGIRNWLEQEAEE